ncbi:MAG: hypothetical protein F6J93_17905 [Oscillatoria sp. SIO1A7]|nr:hypothetical protein [Oscillatoria sp. SIO1A7]
MTRQILINVPENLLAENTDETLGRELCLLAAVKLCELGRISSDKAAELAGISPGEFLLALEDYKVFPLAAELVYSAVEPEIFQEFLAWREQRLKSSLADSFAELRQICAEENYTIEVPPRYDRPNAFIDVLDELSL